LFLQNKEYCIVVVTNFYTSYTSNNDSWSMFDYTIVLTVGTPPLECVKHTIRNLSKYNKDKNAKNAFI